MDASSPSKPRPTIQPPTLTLDLPWDGEWYLAFADAPARSTAHHPSRRELDRMRRQIARVFDVPLYIVGLAPPPLAIDGHAYHRRQRNRIKRRRR